MLSFLDSSVSSELFSLWKGNYILLLQCFDCYHKRKTDFYRIAQSLIKFLLKGTAIHNWSGVK